MCIRDRDTFSPRIKGDDIVIEELKMSDDEIRAIKKIMIVACGSANHTGTVSYTHLDLRRLGLERRL